MTKENYLHMICWAEASPVRKRILCGINHIFPILLAVLYIFSLLTCFLMYPVFLLRLIFRPLFCFILVTILRVLIHAKRPYDVYDFKPLCGFHPGKDKSFPSRHSASAFIIALEIWNIWKYAGILALMLAVCIGISRVLCGNHFIKDVLGGFLIAFLFYFL